MYTWTVPSRVYFDSIRADVEKKIISIRRISVPKKKKTKNKSLRLDDVVDVHVYRSIVVVIKYKSINPFENSI